ncbi:MAG: hypothetical protein ACK4L8_05860 [Nitrincola lacisaponensis]
MRTVFFFCITLLLAVMTIWSLQGTQWKMTLFTGLLTLGFGLTSVKRLLPDPATASPKVKNLRALLFITAFFAFVFAVKMIQVA